MKKVLTFRSEKERMAFLRSQYKETPIQPISKEKEVEKPKEKKKAKKSDAKKSS